MTKKKKKAELQQRRQLTEHEREQLLDKAIALMNLPSHLQLVDDFWDPERELEFRPSLFKEEPDIGRFLCGKLIITYRKLVKRELAAQRAAPAKIKKKLEALRALLLEIAGIMDATSQLEYRVIAQAALGSDWTFLTEIIPHTSPESGGASKPSRFFRIRADNYDQLLKHIGERHEGTVWSKEIKWGRGHNLLRWLGHANHRWQLIHMTWRIFEDIGCPLPPHRAQDDLAEYLSYIHELATGERDAEFDADLSRYTELRFEFDPLARILRAHGVRFGCETFYQLEQYVEIRAAAPAKSTALVRRLTSDVARYRSLRRQLLTGPDPIPRKRKGAKDS